ncbi:MAG: prenyltransferase [Pseudomonadaceae bacterium]|nr:prenyltransferase [Pseudomonadaceae bacterium]
MQHDSDQRDGDGAEASSFLWPALTGVPRLTELQFQASSIPVRWLVASRAAVIAMTLFAVLFAFSITGWVLDPLNALLVLTGTLAAHACNNLLNDYVDVATGLDTDNYFRARYGSQPLAAGWLSKRQHLVYSSFSGVVALSCGLLLLQRTGGEVLWPMLAGCFFVLFYTWPLKHIALGELAVWIVWGPLMIGGAVLATTGTVSADALFLAGLYGLGPLVVILAKHTDKRDDDIARRVRTLPTLLSEKTCRLLIAAAASCQVLLALGWAAVAAQPSYLLVVLALPALCRMLSMLRHPRPVEPPADYPDVWPLWFAAAGFAFARMSGFVLLVAATLTLLL